jgi:nuclear receptor-binding protein
MVTEENINKTIESLEDEQQKDFIYKCLSHDPSERPSARELLFHPLLFEVHTLKLLVAHCLLNTARKTCYYYILKIYSEIFSTTANFSDTITDEMMRRRYKPDVVLADIPRINDPVEFKLADVPAAEKLEKFLEDVKYVLCFVSRKIIIPKFFYFIFFFFSSKNK